MKLLLDMYKSAPKEQRDKVQLMAAERKAKAEVRAAGPVRGQGRGGGVCGQAAGAGRSVTRQTPLWCCRWTSCGAASGSWRSGTGGRARR